MLQQPTDKRNVNKYYLADEKKHIDMLNKALGDIELTKSEESSLIWLCGWETEVIRDIISVFEKAKEQEIRTNVDIINKITGFKKDTEKKLHLRYIELDLIDSIANFIEMDSKKVAFFIDRIGFAWIDEPDIIGVTEVQKAKIIELKNLLRRRF